MSSIWKCYPIENFQNDDNVEGVLNNGYEDNDYQLDAILNSEIDKALGISGKLNYPYVEDFENTRISTKEQCRANNPRNTFCENNANNAKHGKQGCYAACTDPKYPMARGKCNDYARVGLLCGPKNTAIEYNSKRNPNSGNNKMFKKREKVPGSI